MMYCLRRSDSSNPFSPFTRLTEYSYIPLLILPLPLSLSPIHLSTLLILTYIVNRPCIYCSFLLVILFASSCHWSEGRCFWSIPSIPLSNLLDSGVKALAGGASEGNNTATVGGLSGMSTRSGTTGPGSSALANGMSWGWQAYFIPRIYTTPPEHGYTYSNTDDAMVAFMSEVTNSSVSGLASAAFDGTSYLTSSLKERVVGTAISNATTVAKTSSDLPAASGIGTGWLKSLLGGRTEWTLPCVGVKVVL